LTFGDQLLVYDKDSKVLGAPILRAELEGGACSLR
jgi:hypothetical protein